MTKVFSIFALIVGVGLWVIAGMMIARGDPLLEILLYVALAMSNTSLAVSEWAA